MHDARGIPVELSPCHGSHRQDMRLPIPSIDAPSDFKHDCPRYYIAVIDVGIHSLQSLRISPALRIPSSPPILTVLVPNPWHPVMNTGDAEGHLLARKYQP